jgi:hypothetical protein
MSEPDVKLEHREGGASMAPLHERASVSGEDSEPAIDDQGTNQAEAAEILREIRNAAFEFSDEKLALALGRSSEEITGWLNGEEKVDSDALIKARALASERGVEYE